MKKTLLLALLALTGSNLVQAQSLQRQQQQLQPTTLHHAPAKTIEAADGQMWWGYVDYNSELYGLGTTKAETYHCAIFVPGSRGVLLGKQLKALRFYLGVPTAENVKVWVASRLPSGNITTSNTLEVVELSEVENGYNDVELTKEHVIGALGVYVGYSFDIPSVTTEAEAYPIAYTPDEPMTNTLLLRTSESLTSWDNYDYGRLYMQVLIEGDFEYQNGATLAADGEAVAVVGKTGPAFLTVMNMGTNRINDIDVTVSYEGTASQSQHVVFDAPLRYGDQATVTMQMEADATSGVREKTVTITQVNGVANECQETGKVKLSTLSKEVFHGVAVEEFTGTGCGWCPRGLVGMEKLRNTFGDQFVGICVHGYNNTDPMYLAFSSGYHPNIFSGSAPSCQMNRVYGEIDPYYGTSASIIDNFNDQLSIPAMVGLSVTGDWNSDSTKVTATATIEGIIDGGNYTIEYMLIADGLTGTTSSWKQGNYYYQYQASQLPDDLAFLANSGSSYFTTFNDVCLVTSYVNRANKATAPGKVNDGQTKTNTYTLTMPTKAALKAAIKNDKVAVVAILVDKNTGVIANAAKYYLPTTQVNGISTPQADKAEVARYDAAGRLIAAPQKGLNIIRYADGTTRKVMVAE